MVRYRFETSTVVKELDMSIQSITEESFVQTLTTVLFGDKTPPFELQVVGSMDADILIIRRNYSKRFKPEAAKKVEKTKRKRRWKSPEPLLDIARRRGWIA